jgi:hypothetical protein
MVFLPLTQQSAVHRLTYVRRVRKKYSMQTQPKKIIRNWHWETNHTRRFDSTYQPVHSARVKIRGINPQPEDIS